MSDDAVLNARISRYWDLRSASYFNMRQKHLHGQEFSFWQNELKSNLPSSRKPLKILDIGTGTGFLAIVAASLGHEVTGIDISEKMIEVSDLSAKDMEMEGGVEFLLMDGARLSYEDETFDVVMCRNTIWTVYDASKVYSESYRVLKSGGHCMIYDVDYGKVVSGYPADSSQEFIDLMKECDAYKSLLAISKVERPGWDIMALRNIGFVHCECRRNISSHLNPHGAKQKSQRPMFAIFAVKPTVIKELPINKGFEAFYRHNQLFYREMRLFGDKQDTEYLVLDLLCRQPEGLRSSDIMEHFYIPKQTLTRVIAQLTKEDLIEQRKNPRDFRSILLYATEKGYLYHREQTMERFRFYAEVLESFSVEKLEKLNELYMELLNLMKE